MLQLDEHRLYATIGDRIKQARALRGLSQGELATEAGLERTSVTNIEGGKQRPPVHILFRLCAALYIEPTELFPYLEELTTRCVVEVPHQNGTIHLPPYTASIIQELRFQHEAS